MTRRRPTIRVHLGRHTWSLIGLGHRCAVGVHTIGGGPLHPWDGAWAAGLGLVVLVHVRRTPKAGSRWAVERVPARTA